MKRREYIDDSKQVWYFVIDDAALERVYQATGIDLERMDLIMLGRMIRDAGSGNHRPLLDILVAAQLSDIGQFYAPDVETFARAIVAFAFALDDRFGRGMACHVAKLFPYKIDPISSHATKA